MNKNTNYIILTDANFQKEVLENSDPVLVDFWADWCGPCHIIAPSIEELAGEYKGQVKVGKLEVDSNPQTAGNYEIRSIPTLLFFKKGQIVDQVTGVILKKELSDKLSSLL